MSDHDVVATFLQQLPEDRRQIEIAWRAWRASQEDAGKSAALVQAAHRLAGTALTLGYSRIGNAARSLENALKPSTPAGSDLQAMFGELQAALLACERDAGNAQEQTIERAIKNVPSLHESRSTSLVYVVEDDPVQAENLTAQVSHFGYAVQTLTHLADLRTALRQAIPAAVLMDIIFPEGELAGANEVLDIAQEFGGQLPVFFISVRDDPVARLQAIRAGGKGYFRKPVAVDQLIDELDKLIVDVDPQPYRILIVDDSEIQAKTNSMHLRKAGMETLIVTKALDVLKVLEEFNPDLLLLDLYMPDCTGVELAKMIRQIKVFVSLPIVYLSAETDRERQLAAVGLGGDDFLIKPIKPDHLIASVASRIERHRQLQALMSRDGLTGLFNHTAVQERLDQQLAHASRDSVPLSLAMIDVDHFKQVNDAYGHATGDRVLKALAHMLSRRLRASDIIGRFGGDEFITILPNTEPAAAVELMNEMCRVFGQITHMAGSEEFNATFSCGVASFPHYPNPATLSEAADKALYVAKQKGRQQVVAAG
ncbi:MAG: diguanylate cyclase [Chloroflexi bacterium]|nr:diguanylate cyclase [Chloroflexota bacterium]